MAATLLAVGLPPDAPRSHVDPDADGDEPDLGYLAMLRAGLAESLHPRVARAVLLAALVPAFLAFDEYFGLLADDIGVSLTTVPLLVALTVAAQAVGSALAPRLPLHRLGPVVVAAGLLVAAGAAVRVPAGFVAVAVGYGALQAAIVVAETDLQHRIHGAARATVTSVSGLLSELGAIALYAFVAVGSGVASMPALITVLALLVVVLGPGRRPRLPGDLAEADRLPRPQLSALPQVVEGDHADDRVPARRRVVGQEHQRLPVRRHLDGAEHQPLARAAPRRRARASGVAGEPQRHAVGVGGDRPGAVGQPAYAAVDPVRARAGRHPQHPVGRGHAGRVDRPRPAARARPAARRRRPAAAGPSPDSRSVDREPSTGATSTPPDTAT